MKKRNFLKCLAVAVLTFGFAVVAQAQMTDDEVVKYVKTAAKSGKGQEQIARELLARGVERSQLERLRTLYTENKERMQNAAGETNISSADQRMRGSQAPSANQEVIAAVAASDQDQDTVTLAARHRIFGHNLFNGRNLTFEPNENVATPENYVLGPGDEVIIDIWGENEDQIRAQISPEGNIMVSQIGPVYLNGLSIREANTKVRNIFASKYAGVGGEDPASDIRLTLGQIRTIQINVLGEVAVPGTYRLSAFSTVFHALYRAGGVTPIGSLRDIRVMRGDREIARIDVYDYLFKGRQSDNIRLKEGDAILVDPYKTLVNIEGNVKRPMYYELKDGETLAQLLDYAGNFSGDAYTKDVRVVRTQGTESRLFNVGEKEFGRFTFVDGDAVSVGAALDKFANRVEISGAVFRPGMYELGKEVTSVRELVAQAEGVKENAYLTRVQLFREREDLTPEVLAIDLQAILAGRDPDVMLRKNDMLVIPTIQDLKEQETLAINGYVAAPGTYPYVENTTLEDLILRAGGLLDGASMVKVEVSRRLKDPHSTVASSHIGQIFTFSLKDGFVVDGTAGFVLMPFDVVAVRRSPGYQVQRQVTISGEVIFPGNYTLVRKNERISDLVARSGGVTPDAYVRGGRLVRRMNAEERAVREVTIRTAMQNRGADSVSMERLQVSDTTYTVGIDLAKALADPGSDFDVVLREGDRLIVPEMVSTVKVNGEVMYPNTTVWLEDKPLKYYISQAGGYSSRAKKNKSYVVYMNGTVVRGNSKARIEPGCEIIVPSKPKREGVKLAEIMGLTTSAASLGTMAASIANLSK